MATTSIASSGRVNERRAGHHGNASIDLRTLDDSMIGLNEPHQSPPIKMRRDSFSEHTTSFSLSEGPWSGFHFSIENGDGDASSSSQAFFAPQHGLSINTSQNGVVTTRSHWPQARPSGSCTPTPGFDQNGDLGSHRPLAFGQQDIQTGIQPDYEPQQASQRYPMTGYAASPASPRGDSGGGWISASPPDAMNYGTLPTSTHTNSPVMGTTSTQVLRRDGIRKKNARFEIPAERNLRTIDNLINQTTDEREIKELKQQKRLLRNRQAALDSRQRKKQHTERLEEEKKQYTSVISELEDALNEMRLQESGWLREKENLAGLQQQYQRYIETVMVEKEELIRRHTIETGELRKKNAILVEQLQRMDGTAMSTAPSSNGFSADFSDFDHLTMNSWDDFSIAHDFSIEVEPRANVPAAILQKQEIPPDTPTCSLGDEKPVPAGFLLMLLLCGAWVASRAHAASTSDLLPAIPNDLRNASATMLDNIYKDSGVSMYEGGQSQQNPPQHSSSSGTYQPTDSGHPSFGYTEGPRPSLEAVRRRLITPNEQQAHEQAFSLTPSQYNDLSAGTPCRDSSLGSFQNSRTLGELLSIKHTPNERVAETYTRSLLKDKVSTQILQDFAQMVAKGNLYTQSQWKPESLD